MKIKPSNLCTLTIFIYTSEKGMLHFSEYANCINFS